MSQQMRAQLSGRELSLEERRGIAARLPEFLQRQRWFGGKARGVRAAEIVDVIAAGGEGISALWLIVGVKYEEGTEERYSVPMLRVAESDARGVDGIDCGGTKFIDALQDEMFLTALLGAIQEGKTFGGEKGSVWGARTEAFASLYGAKVEKAGARLLSGEQSNSSAIYGDRLILKFIRRMEKGENPDLEIGRFLTERVGFSHAAKVAGHLEYVDQHDGCVTQGILQEFVASEGDGWRHVQKILPRVYEDGGGEACERLLNEMGLLGKRTGELHIALASALDEPAFAPEPFTREFQQQLHGSFEELTRQVMRLLRDLIAQMNADVAGKCHEVLTQEDHIYARFREVLREPVEATRIRIHGDYHLGQVLYTGSDFVIIDFEGEPMRRLPERRVKQSPLQDVAGMLRSFHYAAYAPMLMGRSRVKAREESKSDLRRNAEDWFRAASERFLSEYFATCGNASFLPADEQRRTELLSAYLLAKAVYELGYELNNRPTWVELPVNGILQLLGT